MREHNDRCSCPSTRPPVFLVLRRAAYAEGATGTPGGRPDHGENEADGPGDGALSDVDGPADAAGGSFAAGMIHKGPTTWGSDEGVDVSGNAVDCGPLRNCGSGRYLASEGWYPETPCRTPVDGTTSGLIKRSAVVGAMNTLDLAARGLAIYGNGFLDAHGVSIPNPCHRSIASVTPIAVAPTTAIGHFNVENVDPMMSVPYSRGSWAGCVRSYPF